MQSVAGNFETSTLVVPKTEVDIAWGMTDDVLGTESSGKHTNSSKASAYKWCKDCMCIGRKVK